MKYNAVKTILFFQHMREYLYYMYFGENEIASTVRLKRVANV